MPRLSDSMEQGTIITWLKGDGVDIRKFPRVAAHASRMAEREATKRPFAREAG